MRGTPSAACSTIMKNDFNGKKFKIIQTLRQIDEMNTGVIKSDLFHSILKCLNLEIEPKAFEEC